MGKVEARKTLISVAKKRIVQIVPNSLLPDAEKTPRWD